MFWIAPAGYIYSDNVCISNTYLRESHQTQTRCPGCFIPKYSYSVIFAECRSGYRMVNGACRKLADF
jgi:hypothetical protein